MRGCTLSLNSIELMRIEYHGAELKISLEAKSDL
jgi:hypothetical protein